MTSIRLVSRALCVLLLGSACAGKPDASSRAPATSDVAPASANATPALGDRVCRRERETGTRVSRNVCRSQEEWDRMHDQSVESLKRNQRDADAVTATDG